MRKLRWAWWLWVLVAPGVLRGAEEPPGLDIQAASGSFEWNERSGAIADPNGVIVTYGDTTLTATNVVINRETLEVHAEGSVRVLRTNELWVGDRLEYNFATRQIRTEHFRVGMTPFFASGEGLTGNLATQTHTATNAWLTTDDVAGPTYRVHARRLKFIPGELLEAREATLYLGKTPIMYLPIYRRSLKRHPNNFAFVPGYRSLYGPYLRGEYNWYLSTNLSGVVHLDYRQRRGFGGGPDVDYDLGALGQGQVQGYYLHDQDPLFNASGLAIPSDRQRIGFAHSVVLGTNLIVRAVVQEQSDPLVMRDFFENDYRKDPQPKSFLEVNQLWPNFSLDLLAQAQVNDFFQTVERLPDLKLTAVRQQLGVSPFYYEGENSVSYLRYRTPNVAGTNYAALRADTFHQLILPQTFFGWLNFTPRVGGRFTHYGEMEDTPAGTADQNRGVFNTGAEISAKASRVWRGTESRLLDVHELRHIIEPSINYVYVPSPTRAPQQLPQFDTQLQSLYLVPVEFPDYTAIDSIDSQNVMRFGLRNKLQTKRAGGVDDLVNWAMYLDWRLKPRLDQRTFADVYSYMDLKPRSWLILNSETRFDPNEGVWRMANHTITVEPNDRWSWRVGHRYLRDDPTFAPFLGNNFILGSLYYRVNENWGVRFTHHFDARSGTLQEQYYTVYRDLRSWTTALTFRLRQNQGGPSDFTVAITFSLKAFPRFGLGKDRVDPAILLGG